MSLLLQPWNKKASLPSVRHEPEDTLNRLADAFCMSVSFSLAEWGFSSCPLVPARHPLCVTSILSFFSLLLACARGTPHLWVCACLSLSLFSYSVEVCHGEQVPQCSSRLFVHAQVNTRVHISVHNYSDSQGNCPQSSTTKRILILSGLTVPWSKGRVWEGFGVGGGGCLHQISTEATRVTPLAFGSTLWGNNSGEETLQLLIYFHMFT